jgi:hypothetical protein
MSSNAHNPELPFRRKFSVLRRPSQADKKGMRARRGHESAWERPWSDGPCLSRQYSHSAGILVPIGRRRMKLGRRSQFFQPPLHQVRHVETAAGVARQIVARQRTLLLRSQRRNRLA